MLIQRLLNNYLHLRYPICNQSSIHKQFLELKFTRKVSNGLLFTAVSFVKKNGDVKKIVVLWHHSRLYIHIIHWEEGHFDLTAVLVIFARVVIHEAWLHTQGRVGWALATLVWFLFWCHGWRTPCTYLMLPACHSAEGCGQENGVSWDERSPQCTQDLPQVVDCHCRASHSQPSTEIKKVHAALLVFLEDKVSIQKAHLEEMDHHLLVPPGGFPRGILWLRHLVCFVHSPHLGVVVNNAGWFQNTPASSLHHLHAFIMHGAQDVDHLAGLPL